MEEQQQLHHHTTSPEDGIDLLDLWRVLVRQWKVICVIPALSVLVALGYLFWAPPVYRAQAVLKAPEIKDVEILNVDAIRQISSAEKLNVDAIRQISSAEIFTKFTVNLKSSFLFQQFFNGNPELFPKPHLFVDKKGQLLPLGKYLPEIKEGVKNETGFVYLSLEGEDPKLVADRVNGFIQLVEKETLDNYLAGVEANIANQEKATENQLQSMVAFAGQRRLDRIALLKEQIAIAQAAKIFERNPSNYATVVSQNVGGTVDAVQEPLYMRGVKELTAEKEELEKRKNDEPYIAGFRDKQEHLALLDAGLKQLQAARAIARAVSVDQPGVQAQNPVKPKRLLVLVLSLIAGGMMGVFAAFVVNFVQTQKAKTKD